MRSQASGEDYETRSFMICIPHQILYASSYLEQLDGRGMWHVWRTEDVYTGFWWGNLKERDDLGETGVDGRVILKRILGVDSTDLS